MSHTSQTGLNCWEADVKSMNGDDDSSPVFHGHLLAGWVISNILLYTAGKGERSYCKLRNSMIWSNKQGSGGLETLT